MPLPPCSTLFPYTTLFRSRIRSRLAPGFMQEHAPVERLMLGTHDRQSIDGIERSEEHTSELQSHSELVCRLLLEKTKRHRARKPGIRSADIERRWPEPTAF